jgi:hypothetical protein
MTLAQVQKRLTVLERKIDDLRETIEYQQAVEGIRRGLESVERGEGTPTGKAFAAIRRVPRSSRRK